MARGQEHGGRTGRGVLRVGVALAVVAVLAVVAAPSTADKTPVQLKAGVFSGTTSQGKHMQLKVNTRKRTLIVVFFEVKAPPCGGGTSEGGPLQYAGLKAKINRVGHFHAKSDPSEFYGYVEGNMHRNKASGTAVYHVASRGCDSGEITWHATHPR